MQVAIYNEFHLYSTSYSHHASMSFHPVFSNAVEIFWGTLRIAFSICQKERRNTFLFGTVGGRSAVSGVGWFLCLLLWGTAMRSGTSLVYTVLFETGHGSKRVTKRASLSASEQPTYIPTVLMTSQESTDFHCPSRSLPRFQRLLVRDPHLVHYQ